MRFNRALIGLVCMCLILNGCTTMYSVPIPTGPDDHRTVLASGDRARIWLNDGSRHDVTVVSVQSDHISATQAASTEVRRYDYAQMKALWVHYQPKQREPMSTKDKVSIALIAAGGLAAIAFGYLVHRMAENHE